MKKLLVSSIGLNSSCTDFHKPSSDITISCKMVGLRRDHIFFEPAWDQIATNEISERGRFCTKSSLVAMEACAKAHDWGRQIRKLGHEVKLLPPQYVKPYVKRQKNDRADAEAIAEAATRPTMRFVEVKTEDQQSRAMLFRTRKMLVAQRTQTINALRGHMAEYGVIGPKSKAGLKKLIAALDDETNGLPDIVRDVARSYVEHIETLTVKVSKLTKQLETIAKASGKVQRLKTMPGVGLQTALASEAFASDMSCFERGRDLAAWLGLVPMQHSTGGKDRLGRVSKMGQKDIRSLLITGAMSVITVATRFGVRKGSWLAKMLERKPKMLVAITLANRMARGIWAMPGCSHA